MKKDKRMIFSIIWVILGGVLIALAFAGKVDMFWNGMGSGLLVVGALQLLRQYRFSKNEAYREKIEIEGKVFSAAMGDAWVDITKLTVISSKKPIKAS